MIDAAGQPSRIRYVAEKHQVGRFMFWSVYDTEHASYPAMIRGKRVPDMFDATKPDARANAQAVADALNDGSFWRRP